MRYSEVLRPEIQSALLPLGHLSDAQLVDSVWQRLLDVDAFQGFGSGDRIEKAKEWFGGILRDATESAGVVGGEIRRLLDDKDTVDDLERLTLLIAFVVVMVPSLRDWPVSEVLTLLVFEIRRRQRSGDS